MRAQAPFPAPPARPARPVGALAAQSAAVALAAAAVLLVIVTTLGNLQARGIPIGFEFLGDRAGFKIADTVVPFGPDDSYLRAIGVAVVNTLFLSALVCLAATVIGTALGVARLSANPLVSGLAGIWVEAVRNTPPVLLLIFLYAGWGEAMPVGAAQEILPGVLASIRGVAIPSVAGVGSPTTLVLAASVAVAVYLAAEVAARRAGRTPGHGLPYRRAALLLLGALLVGLLLWRGSSLTLDLPEARGDDILGGARLTPEFATVLFGLTVYTAGFIAEIVRSGIQSVPRGQWEAGRALGLREATILRRVVAPQTLRVIVPPMTSQYINTIKNSTLAITIGYSEFMTVMGTVINRTNHALEGTLIIVGVYMAINLALSAVLNLYNRRVQLGGRGHG